MKHVAIGGAAVVGLLFAPHIVLGAAVVYTAGAGVAAFAKSQKA